MSSSSSGERRSRGSGHVVRRVARDGTVYFKARAAVGGRPVWLPGRFGSERAATQAVEATLRESCEGRPPAKGRLRVRQAWLRECRRLETSARKRTMSAAKLRGVWKTWFAPVFGEIEVRNVRRDHISELAQRFATVPGQQGRLLARSSALSYGAFWARACRTAIALQLAHHDDKTLFAQRTWSLVLDDVAGNHSGSMRPPKKRNALSREQAAVVLDRGALRRLGCREEQIDFWQLALLTGMRLGELLALTWEAIDDQYLSVAVTQTVDFAVHDIKPGRKNHSTLHTVGLLPQARTLLRERRLRAAQDNPTYVFSAAHGRFHGSHWTAGWGKRDGANRGIVWSERILGEAWPFHCLRHTCATALVNGWWMDPLPLTDAQLHLGHDSLKTTQGYYHGAAESLLERFRALK